MVAGGGAIKKGANVTINDTDSLAEVRESRPNIRAIQEEYQLAWSQDPDGYARLAQAEDVRYTRWAGQSPDGLKHQELQPEGQRAMPYDRAPDCRVPLADGTIRTLVDLDYTSFWNARVKTAPVGASRLSVAQAAEWRQVISWMIHGPLRRRLIDQMEFCSQIMHTIGWMVLHPTWRQETQLRYKRLSMDAILALAQQAPPESVLAKADLMMADPTLEEAAVELLQSFFPSLKKARALRVVRELREDGMAEFPAPEPVRNVPEVEVLVPWQDFIMPPEATADPEHARWMAHRMFMTESRLEERAALEEWDADFVAAVKKTKGQSMEHGTSEEHASDVNLLLMEIVYFYQAGVDEEGVPGQYCTVFSPHVPQPAAGAGITAAYGKHWLVDYAHGQLPFIMLTTEVIGKRPADARGVPEVCTTAQLEMKQQRDATYVYSQLSVTPPLQKKGTQASRLPPELGPMGIINNVSGEWSWFPPPPGEPQVAFKLIEDVRRETEDYYGVPRPDLPPQRYVPRQQRQVMRWLAKWGEALWQLSVLAYQNLEPQELQAILGRAPLLNADLVAKHQLLLWFDVRSMDPAWVESLLASVAQWVAMDTGGVIDHAKLVAFGMAYLDPTLADEVTTDQAGAKQALFKGVREEIGAIMQGNEGLYVENDPTAKAKLLFAEQIIGSNPEYMAQLDERSPGFSERKRELLEKWRKNLLQSAMQQDNKIVGRLGVVQPGPANLGGNNGY